MKITQVILSILILVACSSQSKEVLVYGSHNCDHCIKFKAQLEEAGVEYIFNDVDISDEYMLQLQRIIKENNYRGYVSFPVIILDKQLLVNPSIESFLIEFKD